jgi:hypothetical protein
MTPEISKKITGAAATAAASASSAVRAALQAMSPGADRAPAVPAYRVDVSVPCGGPRPEGRVHVTGPASPACDAGSEARLQSPAHWPGARALQAAAQGRPRYAVRGTAVPAESQAEAAPAVGQKMAADAADFDCPLDLSDSYIVSALRALRDSGVDVGCLERGPPAQAQPESASAGAQAAVAAGARAGQRPTSPAATVPGTGVTGVTAAAGLPPQAPSAVRGLASAPLAFAGFSPGAVPSGQGAAGPSWPPFAQTGGRYGHSYVHQRAWQQMQQPLYIPAAALAHTRPSSNGPAAGSAERGAAGPAPPAAPAANTGEGGVPAPGRSSGTSSQQAAAVDAAELAAAAVASKYWGVQLRHFSGKYGREAS